MQARAATVLHEGMERERAAARDKEEAREAERREREAARARAKEEGRPPAAWRDGAAAGGRQPPRPLSHSHLGQERHERRESALRDDETV